MFLKEIEMFGRLIRNLNKTIIMLAFIREKYSDVTFNYIIVVVKPNQTIIKYLYFVEYLSHLIE